MRILIASIFILFLVLKPVKPAAREAQAIWDSRCEECHGDNAEFAAKYLWNIDGELQGQHHVDNLSLFMRQHYTPDHEIEAISDMLLARANSSVRFKAECAECHGKVAEFVKKSIWVRGKEVTGMGTGGDISRFLPTHQGLQAEDVGFFRKLFARIAGKPLPLDTVTKLKFP